jgi:hypothetical protein
LQKNIEMNTIEEWKKIICRNRSKGTKKCLQSKFEAVQKQSNTKRGTGFILVLGHSILTVNNTGFALMLGHSISTVQNTGFALVLGRSISTVKNQQNGKSEEGGKPWCYTRVKGIKDP